MDFAFCVEKLLATPKKRQPVKNLSAKTPGSPRTPERKRRVERQQSDDKDFDQVAKTRRVEETEPGKTPTSKSSAVAAFSAAAVAGAEHVAAAPAADAKAALERDAALTTKLFDGLEAVLVMTAARKGRPTLAVIKEHVGNYTQRDLTDERLERVLHLAEDMLSVAWIGPNLEICQKLENGDTRAPTNAERVERREAFAKRLAAAVEQGALPLRKLPQQPLPPPGLDAQRTAASAPDVKEAATPELTPSAASHSSATTGTERMQALKSRMLVKFEMENIQSAFRSQVWDLERSIATCDDAIVVHSVLGQLFARGEGQDSAATDAEVVQGVCSGGFATQTRRPLDVEAATAALACLRRNAAGWFGTTTKKYAHKPGLILRRLPGGQPAASLEAVRAEQRKFQEELARVGAICPTAGEAPKGDAQDTLAGADCDGCNSSAREGTAAGTADAVEDVSSGRAEGGRADNYDAIRGAAGAGKEGASDGLRACICHTIRSNESGEARGCLEDALSESESEGDGNGQDRQEGFAQDVTKHQ